MHVVISGAEEIGLAQLSKLTAGYCRLILKQVALQVEEDELRHQNTAEHPMLRRKHQELSALELEIELLLR